MIFLIFSLAKHSPIVILPLFLFYNNSLYLYNIAKHFKYSMGKKS